MPLHIVRQDITEMKVDAIVNTTNEKMIGYSGVDFAVHKKAGAELDKECSRLALLEHGRVRITKGYKLSAEYIFHTCGPIWHGGCNGEEIILKSCYTECLKEAVHNNLKSIAFPLISSGAYGYPKDKVLKHAVQIISEFLFDNELDVYICVFDRTAYEFSKVLFDELTDFISADCCESDIFDFSEPSVISDCSILLSESSEDMRAARASNDTNYVRAYGRAKNKSLEEYIRSMDKPFAYKLFDLIDERGMTDVECYKKANVDKKTFSKIKCHPDTYKPSKQTAVAFAIALKLNLDETQELLSSAGLTLSHSFVFDKIIRYFIQKEIYDIFEINEALFEFDQMLLGC